MNEKELNTILLEAFPELREDFEEYTSWQDGLETGCFITFEDLLKPLARQALQRKDSSFLKRLGAFIEELITSDSGYARNVAIVGLIEGLKDYGDLAIRNYLGPVSLKEFDELVY